MSRGSVRHPVRGVLAGLGLGIGAALQLVHHGRIAIGTMAPYAVVAAGVVFGVLWALLTPVPALRGATPALPAEVSDGADGDQ